MAIEIGIEPVRQGKKLVCVREFSVTGTTAWDNQFIKRKGLFWLTVLRLQSMDIGPSAFRFMVRHNIVAGACGRTRLLNSCPRSKREQRTELKSYGSLTGCNPMTWRSLSRFQLLTLFPLPKSAERGTKPLVHESLKFNPEQMAVT